MASRRVLGGLLLAAGLLLSRCAAPRPDSRDPAASAAPRGQVVLVSFDGVAGERLASLLGRPGALPAGGYRGVAARGFFAVHSVPPTPSLTAVAHVTHVTGALPQDTGIVSNTLRNPSGPFGSVLSGFRAPIRAETLWEAARRQGKRTGVMLYPGADGTSLERTADFGMAWPEDPVAPPKLHVIEAPSWQPLAAAPAGTFSPARRVTLRFAPMAHAVSLTALDATDDRQINYDLLQVEAPDGRSRQVRAGDWFGAELPSAEGRTGAWCKLLVLAPDLSRAEVYLGGLHRSLGYPAEFLRRLDEEIGFWPGPPDSDAFGARSARPEVFLEQADRLADFITRAQLLALARSDWDLMLMYNAVSDETGHEFLLADPRQRDYTPERSRVFQSYVDRGYELADRSLRAIDAALDPADSLFVTSDHGMTPLWRQVYPNEVLRTAGLVVVNAENEIAPESRAFAVTSSGITHVYVNPSADASVVLPAAEKALRDFRVNGESPWELVVTRDEAGPVGLRAPESGDLILLAHPGIGVSRTVRPERGPVGVPGDLGGHGYLNVHPQLDATFLAAGPGIRSGRVPRIRSWEIAARVSAALGIDPPRQAASAGP
ncbi:MAG: alkaline phosphatase family protein [Thermoanaerobaculia bacterium]